MYVADLKVYEMMLLELQAAWHHQEIQAGVDSLGLAR